MIIHLFSLFGLPLIEPTQSFCLSFAKGPINRNSPFACLLTIFSLRQTKEKDEGGAGSMVQAGEKALCSLHLLGFDTTVCQKTTGESFQGYHQTGAAWDEITQRRTEDEMLLVTPLSLNLSEEVAGCIPNCSWISFALKRFFFSLPHFFYPC